MARARARAHVWSHRQALKRTKIRLDGPIGSENLGVEHGLEVFDREVDGRYNGVSSHGDKLGPVVNGTAEQARGADESDRAQCNGKERTDRITLGRWSRRQLPCRP